MLPKDSLEAIIAAWPDENGVSSNPEVIERWLMMEHQYFVDKVHFALGTNRIDALTERQAKILNRRLEDLKNKRCVFDITYEEIEGQYELVTEHISPAILEDAVRLYRRKKDMH